MFETITLDTDARGVCTLTLNRAEKHNAMSGQMLQELTLAAKRLAEDDTVRVVVLTGAGKSFCAGGDLAWMRAQMDADAETRAREARVLAEMLMALNTLPKPLIGAVQGNAFGGGVGMASVCDVAIGADHLKMGLTETKLGLIPATIGPYVIARMGEAKARRVFMSARLFGAAEAVELGLLAKAVPAEQLGEAVEAEVAPYLNCAPGAVAAAKKLARDLGPRLDDSVIDHTIKALVERWEGPEAGEGIAAFFEKRKPAWQS
ncbi:MULTISPECIES: crotonase/enoyl-CoA hydratase family protein [unclassified Leisingera]|uniref:crotonase/enoyl-CoA hydratase family protein n=1 Tax=unclassified Leisingera TaxID=2614906 RepID=UPI0002F70324|nr:MULTISPECIES: crotonase/enoyl-CoA hydratase family protein [unclassified Leisingera]KIC26337.1 enoyl-CoA hydratase [Leisingera sp. ANG-S3]KIC33336.1 enoyl-CoA hydratase [Leisingera sp. ANG-S5]KIC52656.1 enoyl-CoA hydratase [Leisingera sp. ANG-S]KID08134.1 enoyl-CoA hydratase [Leisingera sp. ANG1]